MSGKTPLLILLGVLLLAAGCEDEPRLVVASKHFNESYLLAEIMSQLLEDHGHPVERRFGLGGTMICFQAIQNREIDLYPEYSGTLEQAILKLPDHPDRKKLNRLLKTKYGLELLPTFGFNNTYALAVRQDVARKYGLRSISDLREHPELRFAFSHEFLHRKDGWGPLAEAYQLNHSPRGIEHGLIYAAIEGGKIDVIDAWTTDAEIQRYDLVLLEDDRDFFPVYMAAPLLHEDADPRVKRLLTELAGRIDENKMQQLNAAVTVRKKTFPQVAREFLDEQGLSGEPAESVRRGFWQQLAHRTATHIKLTLIAVLAGMAVAIPAGVLIYRVPSISKPILYTAGLLQTIPSIALLAFMIPLFGIGVRPAIAALFLYALLPILRNTYAALQSLDPVMKKVAVGMGLTTRQRLLHIELPLSMPTLLTGVRTATVINIGTATLAAFIGAGGLGEPIVTGLALNNTNLILQGAVPAACLAILAELFFEGLERWLIPRHLAQAKGL